MTEIEKPGNKNWTADEVHKICQQMQLVERVRAADRALIDNQFNGGRPYTPEEVKEYDIHINVNWGEGKHILLPAINQLNNALIFKNRFFTATSKGGPVEKKEDFSETFTANIHKYLTEGITGQRQLFTLKSRNAAVALHGIGPIVWLNQFRWRGRFIPLEDLLIPTDTLCDFSNLMYFGINLYLTVGEFFDMATNYEKETGWYKKGVDMILKDMVKPNQRYGNPYYAIVDQPEKRVEWLKQNRQMWAYDATKTVKLRMFFYKDYDTKKWHRCIVLRESTENYPAERQDEFLYDGNDEVFANSINQIMHVQYSDNSVVAPLKYPSVRGLGVDLYSPVECNNKTRCEFQQHVLFQLKTLLRINNPIDRDRPKVMDLSQYSVLEQGIDMIPANLRYQVDPRLIQEAMGQVKQIMGESGAGYVKNVESATSQPRTATETSVLSNQATENISNTLQSMYAQETYYYEEIVRRFLDEDSEDGEVKEFQDKCVADGIPKNLMKQDNWVIHIERVLGGGDQFVANQEADMLLSQSGRYDPPSQRIILRKWTSTKTRDPKMAQLLVPADNNRPTSGEIEAENVFGTLMQGVALPPRDGFERTEYIMALLKMLQANINATTQMEPVPTAGELMGMQAVLAHVQANLQILASDENQKQFVKQAGDIMGQISNNVKMLSERYQEQQKASQADPEAQAKAQAITQQAQLKQQIATASSQQKMQISQQKHEQKMVQSQENHMADMQRMNQELQAELQAMHAELIAKGILTGSDVAAQHVKTQADIENSRIKATQQPVDK